MTRNKIATIVGICAVLAIADATLADVFAQTTSGSSTVFTNLQSKASDLFYNARSIVLVVCALAIIATMATAISGRFPVGKALAIVGAIVVIGLASEIVTYFASGTTNSSANGTIPSLTDTAQSSTSP